MNLEIVEFYPIEKRANGFYSGNIKIQLQDLNIYLLGVYVAKRTTGNWLILMPSKMGMDKNGNKIHYPVVHFQEEFHRQLMAELHAKVPDFVEKRLADTENPIIFPEKQRPVNNQSPAKPSQPVSPLPPSAPAPQANQKPSAAFAASTSSQKAGNQSKASPVSKKSHNAPTKTRTYVDLAPPSKPKSFAKR